jgi:adenylate cyclase
MAEGSFKRKLTAVFSADVVGYSRLMGEDEAATVRTLEGYKGVMSELIRQHRRRVVDSPGDNLLAEFASVVDAVQCAVAIQNELKARNAELLENRRMQFRIGINLGDVIEEGERIYGDGVNIAARLESLADPGGICVSKTAFDHIETKLPLGYEFLGEQEVKNIAKRVGAYRVLMDPRVTVAGAKAKAPKVPLWRHKTVLAGAMVVLVAIIGVGGWNFYWRAPRIEPASKEKMAFPLPDRPSIAVLPFVNMSGDPQQEYLSDGITESIIMAVSKIHNLFVIARNSTFTYKGKAVKAQQVAQELGVQYVLEGSVQKSGDRLRITAQLIDALKGSHVWSQRYDRKLTDLYAMQDDITMEILQAMRVKLTEGEQVSRAKRPKNIESALKAYEALGYLLRFTPEANDMARKLAEEVVATEPGWGEGHLILSQAHMMDVWLGTTSSPKESIGKAIALSENAISLDDSLAEAFGLIGYLYGMRREHEKSVAYAEQGVTKDPNGADAHAWLGNCLNWAARPQEAIPHYEQAMRLNPSPPQWYYINLGSSYRMPGRHEEALAQVKKTLALAPTSSSAYTNLVATYEEMGKEDEARAAAVELLRIMPKFSVKKVVQSLPHKDQEFIRRYVEALRKAGLPE